MINFKIAGQEEPKQLEASLAMDCDGDVNLLINGESIAYISSKDGVLRRLSTTGTNLEHSGLCIDKDGFIESDTKTCGCDSCDPDTSEEEIMSLIKKIKNDVLSSLKSKPVFLYRDARDTLNILNDLDELKEKILGANK
ncbi:hypothetical protein UFOVP459_45 [uncultured Caudovirales phage]|uniref:Uncharacterized protein n=1 Tax=uncultured Caudovirales phage TaxID=2100421 RepID=A0A6J5SGH6_9CAUD|nr:hypothetical protein UFOVP459_45 [uncultured Caudovirales phage]CAB4183141.1 hypothetical protein UFOVP1089_40 [uncultured Caudovirales phage]CAB4213040.1 hypothetical protein UFOVP1443_59 [uncultured Caudovirales phage]